MGRHRKKRQPKLRKPIKRSRKQVLSKNPFLNFLREFRRICRGLPMLAVTRLGAAEWKGLTYEQKKRFLAQARKAAQMEKKKLVDCKSDDKKKKKNKKKRNK